MRIFNSEAYVRGSVGPRTQYQMTRHSPSRMPADKGRKSILGFPFFGPGRGAGGGEAGV